ncbi:hypothetical protein COV19_05985 [Candidatus Woesearchaeota archaeon CG10_big_fil_rev_8_21_14_0_10_44_13]|nr:MAG: hypothetical protein COV19_05985 [Candidatus Woesearchaeota archaeon CG10_big_fil_rev_8_21_14_0_10_44_13]
MKCSKHQKQSIATCQWCGKLLCRECIAKTNGKKAYCTDCSGQVGEYVQRIQLDQIRKDAEAEQKKNRFAGIFQR